MNIDHYFTNLFLGNVVDGIVDGIEQSGDIFDGDIDYTVDDTTMSITFNGFKSTLHGIKYFVWAVGTSPDREDSLPFTERGLTFTVEMDDADNSKNLVHFFSI